MTLIRKFLLLLATLLAYVKSETIEPVYNISDFHSKLFWKINPSGLYSVDVGMTLDSYLKEGIYVVHVADVNADSFNDLITLNQTNNKMRIHVYSKKQYKFICETAYVLDDTDCQI